MGDFKNMMFGVLIFSMAILATFGYYNSVVEESGSTRTIENVTGASSIRQIQDQTENIQDSFRSQNLQSGDLINVLGGITLVAYNIAVVLVNGLTSIFTNVVDNIVDYLNLPAWAGGLLLTMGLLTIILALLSYIQRWEA